MVKNDVRIRILGRVSELPEDIQAAIRTAEESSKDGKRLTLNIMLNYGGKAELVDAVKTIANKVQEGALAANDISEKTFDDHIYTAGMPDPDLLIRTSGELRLSNFMLWQLAYSEFYFTDTLWPDFRKQDLVKAVIEYQQRNRRKGDIA
jgi:undecaprenyl diphosphate synthase